MDIQNLRVGIVETINDLNKMVNASKSAKQQLEILKLLKVKNALLDAVVSQELKKSTPQYKRALRELVKAEKATKDAVKDIKKIANGIKRAQSAARAVGRVVGLGISFL
ncbi:MAG: hypothetical protein AAF493_19690 [Pseudomonadota bacterium]